MSTLAPHQARDVETLRHSLGDGARSKFVYFWGHRPPFDGGLGASCFSQWWASSFEVSGVRYPTAEHYMMAEKARLFGDDEIRRQILASSHPGEAKKLGRSIRSFSEEIWQQHRFEIVVDGNLAKFSQNHELRAYLLGTGHRILVEASPVDRIWGIGLARDDRRAADPALWQGLNLLGFALMEVRQRLIDGFS